MAAYVSGVGPLLGHWLEHGQLRADAATARVFAEHLEQGRRRAERLERYLTQLLEPLAAAGVTPTVLKGSDTAYRYFPEPGTRPRADIDLLIRPDQRTVMAATLEALGYVEYRRTRYADRSEWRLAGTSPTPQRLEIDHADNPWSLDLHVTLDRWYFRGRRAGFARPTDDQLAPWTVAGRRVHVLAQPLLTAYLALNASYDIRDFRPLRAVELVLVVRHDTGTGALRWDALGDLLHRTGTVRFVYPALELAERWIPGTVPPDLQRQLRAAPTPRMRRVVDQVETHGLQLPRRTLDEKLMWARGPAELMANWSELMWSADDMLTVGDKLKRYLRRTWMFLRRRATLRARPRGTGS
ncbi:MAG: nucleotidyltransferase family protein [Gemmatimonadetes bacterium]|nr:nucleotidyltransferase family protein [Gemmatimonadota bacterium]MBI2404293.1 nucleotidyltransferase family protein [Gemmatimonadota bacterium]MBI2535689.1 nucleotidyltransferase family protein [Gemmatimonadota bacterium]